MDVRLGSEVFGRAGKKIGEVVGLVVNAGTKRAAGILIDKGIFERGEQIVGVSAIQRSDADGLYLDQSAMRTEKTAPELDSEEIGLPQRVEPPTTYIPAGGVGGPIVADTPSVPGRYPDDSSFFDLAPIDPPPVEIFSNLGENEVRLDKGTDVLSSDGHKVGEAVSFTLGDMGLVEQVTVSEGFLRKEETTFSLADIGEFGTNTVHLLLDKSGAERR
jgi:hypothetical protein